LVNARETGLEQVQNGEGVFGLRRNFQNRIAAWAMARALAGLMRALSFPLLRLQ
jgi:hypothetical protein